MTVQSASRSAAMLLVIRVYVYGALMSMLVPSRFSPLTNFDRGGTLVRPTVGIRNSVVRSGDAVVSLSSWLTPAALFMCRIRFVIRNSAVRTATRRVAQQTALVMFIRPVRLTFTSTQLTRSIRANDSNCPRLVRVMVLRTLIITAVKVMVSSSLASGWRGNSSARACRTVQMLIPASRLVNMVAMGVGVAGQELGS